IFFLYTSAATAEFSRLSLHDALPIYAGLGTGLSTGLDLAFNVGAHIGQQFFDIAFGLAQGLGEFGIDFRQDRLGDFRDRDLELGGFAGHFLAAVFLGECQREGLGFTGLHAAHGGFELGQHAALAQNEGEFLGGAAIKCHTVDGADEIQRNAVVVLGLAAVARFVFGTLF